MNRDDFIEGCLDAADSGSLLTAKHDPNKLHITWDKTRSVLTPHVSASLEAFISSGDYELKLYDDASHPKGAGYFEITPGANSVFADVGAMVPSGSVNPTGSLDRLVVVSGSYQGWHIFAESSQEVSGSIASGRLTLKGTL